jgi:hypothetical protein
VIGRLTTRFDVNGAEAGDSLEHATPRERSARAETKMLSAAACREEPARMGPAGTRHFRTSGSQMTRSPG